MTPVIATIILSAVVITVGGAVWSYSQGATTVIANDYVNGTMALLEEAIERFTIEHVTNNSDNSVLYVWIYNYGDLNVTLDVYANATGGASNLISENDVADGTLVRVDMPLSTTSGDQVAIKVVSRRGNNAYNKYLVP